MKIAKRTICLVTAIVLVLSLGVGMVATNTQNRAFAENKNQVVQARGVWHRPNTSGKETTLEGICEVLDTFKNAGINLVFLETFYHGMSVFKTNLVQYYKGFENYTYGDYPDYATAFAAEAEKRGIEVHAWVEDFYIGISEDIYFVKYYKDWLLKNQNGEIRQSEGASNGGYIFLDPSNSEVRNYLVSFYAELLKKIPQIKGLNLDYIRYPVSTSNDDTGYTKSAMLQFSQQEGLGLDEASDETAMRTEFTKKLKSNNLQEKWTAFRANCVTIFVQQIFEMMKENRPDAKISTAVFPEKDVAYSTKKQDFATWLERGYLDMVTPMVYYDYNAQTGTSQIATFKSYVSKILQLCPECYCYVGLYSTFHRSPESIVLEQVKFLKEVGADGFVFFDSGKTFFEKCDYDYNALLQQQFYQTAVLPHTTVEQLVNVAISQVESLKGSVDETDSKLLELLEKLQQLKSTDENAGDVSGAASEVENLAQNLSQYVADTNLTSLQNTLQCVGKALEIRALRLQARGLESPSEQEPDNDNPSQPSDDNGSQQGGGSGNTDNSQNSGGDNSDNKPDSGSDDVTASANVLVYVCLAVAVGVSVVPLLASTIKKKSK